MSLLLASVGFTSLVTGLGALAGLLTALGGVAVALKAFVSKDDDSDVVDKATRTLIETIGRVDGERDAALERAEKAEAASAQLQIALAKCEQACSELKARSS
jgi:hypothetical protein